MVIRGETYHFEIVAGESARALMALTLDGLAIGNGILTVENEAQALARADPDDKDKGGEAAKAALAMLALQGALRLTGRARQRPLRLPRSDPRQSRSWRRGRGWCGSPMSGRSPPASGGWRWRCRSSPCSPGGRAAAGPCPAGRLIAAVALGGLFFAADLAAWHEGILRTKLANATLFGNFASFLFAIYGFVLLRSLPRPRCRRSRCCSPRSARRCCSATASSCRARHFTGDLLALLAGLFYALYLIAVDRARQSDEALAGARHRHRRRRAADAARLACARRAGHAERLDAGDPALDLAAS